MNLEELRGECTRLFNCDTLADNLELIDIYSEYLFSVIKNQKTIINRSIADNRAVLINQMMFSKVLNVKKIVEGFHFNSKDGTKLNNIIDPTILASLCRNIYETICMFNIVYIKPRSEEEKLILYNLWVHAGLKYRQSFESAISIPENQNKLLVERTEMEKRVEEIKATALYTSLSPQNKQKILNVIKQKDYKIEFNGEEVKIYTWKDLAKVVGIKQGILDHMYTYFSLYAHPSYVAVFQFEQMFDRNEMGFLYLTITNLAEFFILISIFIADYIKLYPETLSIYNNLNIRDQIVINFRNTFSRGYEYSINDSWKEVN